jgi:HEAT repeat protein
MPRFLAALVFLLLTGCTPASPPPTAITPPAGPSTLPAGFPDTPAGRAAVVFLVSVHGGGPDAEARYQRALTDLRGVGDEAVVVLVDAYRAAPAPDYARRRLLVAGLAALERPAALPPLLTIAREPVPEPARIGEHAVSPHLEEALIRMAAVHGIGLLAAAQQAPLDPLFELLQHPVLPVREEASRALTMAATELKLGGAVLDRIPPELRFDLRPRDTQPIPPRDADPRLQPKSGGTR